jgi:hypothetical protein
MHVFPILGSGPFLTHYNNISELLFVELDIEKGSGHISISGLDLHLHVDKMKVKFDGLGGNQMSSQLYNRVLNLFSNELFAHFEPTLRKEWNHVFKQQFNHYLKVSL